MKASLSYWEQESFLKKADIAIIGSGLVGLSAAIRLKEIDPKLNVVIYERGVLPTGASTRNAGFACFGSLTELMSDLKTNSEETVFSLVQKRWEGLQNLRNLIGDDALDFQLNGNYELFGSQDEAVFADCLDRLQYFNQQVKQAIGKANTYTIADSKITQFNFASTTHLIKNQYEGQIHTGKMMRKLIDIATSKGIRILNGINITNIEDENGQVRLQTQNDWTLSATQVLICTNGFAKNLLPQLNVTPARNQVLITKPIKNLKVKGCFHANEGYIYFRNVGNRILLGGARNLDPKTEITDQLGTTDTIQKALKTLLKSNILPNQKFEIEHIWSGILGIGETKAPIIQSVSKNISVAVRMGGMGVAIGSLVGRQAAEMIYEK